MRNIFWVCALAWSFAVRAADTYDLDYSRLSGLVGWPSGSSIPQSSELFDFGEVPQIPAITIDFDVASLRATLTGGGSPAVRRCIAKSKWDLLECEMVPVNEVISPEGCKVERFDQENFGFNRQVEGNVFFMVHYFQFSGDCSREKARIAKKIAPGARGVSLPDVVSLGHIYFARVGQVR